MVTLCFAVVILVAVGLADIRGLIAAFILLFPAYHVATGYFYFEQTYAPARACPAARLLRLTPASGWHGRLMEAMEITLRLTGCVKEYNWDCGEYKSEL